MSNSVNEISVDGNLLKGQCSAATSLKYLPKWPAVNIEFQDLVYSIPEIGGGNNVILRGVSGKFKSGQLTAILGPSGAGKSTLLNVLAGFKVGNATGNILINDQPRDIRKFRKMSRYIMQDDICQPMLTVKEMMMIAADLKLGYQLAKEQKIEIVDEILSLLRLTKSENTVGHRLSGGERKRLSIALELVNNPPVIFLDEPTTGLDDLSSSQCVALLQRIARGGRTVVCSIHTPSAKIFQMFDHVFVLAEGQCVYQGKESNIIDYTQSFGLNCPLTYNPADFMIDVASGEYGYEYVDKMISQVDNGRCYSWMPTALAEKLDLGRESQSNGVDATQMSEFVPEFDAKHLQACATSWDQFCILYRRRTLQMWRDSSYLKIRVYMTLFLGLVVGGIYQGVGNDASKALFNFGFCFTVTIAFMYNPLMPVLLSFPFEVQLLKREHFNRWYRVGPYYLSMLAANMPLQIVLAIVYVTMIYLLSDQPLELYRMAMFYSISVMIALTSESLGVLIASRLSLINGMFVGPVMTVPLMLLSVYGIGYGRNEEMSPFWKIVMSFSYLRYGLEGLIDAMYGHDREDTICPHEEIFCMFSKAKFLKFVLGFEDVSYAVAIVALTMYYLIFTVAAFYMIKTRLSPSASNNVPVQYIGRLIKTHLNFASYKY